MSTMQVGLKLYFRSIIYLEILKRVIRYMYTMHSSLFPEFNQLHIVHTYARKTNGFMSSV